jgi:putative DNA primase/helicase
MKSNPQNNRRSWIAACCHAPSREQILRAAKLYVASGLSLIPTSSDGSKQPAIDQLPLSWCEKTQRWVRGWAIYLTRRPMLFELERWFIDRLFPVKHGMAILGGATSGNLEILDLDNWDVIEPWERLVKKQAPGLLEKLVGVRTPRPGMHLYYRCEVIGGNDKLACVPEKDEETGKIKPKTLIETRGEGGYCLAPPSPAACHPRCKCYVFLDGRDLTMVPTISPEDREILLAAARSLNRWTEPERPVRYDVPRHRADHGAGGRPGDDFNARADWSDILVPHGWRQMQVNADGSESWCRPGKSGGTSATINHGGTDLLYVFRTNGQPFDDGKGYTRFHAYALLNHDGDFSAAAQALARRGYGSPHVPRGQQRKSRADSRFSRYANYQVRSARR